MVWQQKMMSGADVIKTFGWEGECVDGLTQDWGKSFFFFFFFFWLG